MLENLLSIILSDYLGEYINNLNKNDIKLSLWDGKLQLENLVELIILLLYSNLKKMHLIL